MLSVMAWCPSTTLLPSRRNSRNRKSISLAFKKNSKSCIPNPSGIPTGLIEAQRNTHGGSRRRIFPLFIRTLTNLTLRPCLRRAPTQQSCRASIRLVLRALSFLNSDRTKCSHDLYSIFINKQYSIICSHLDHHLSASLMSYY